MTSASVSKKRKIRSEEEKMQKDGENGPKINWSSLQLC